LTDFFDSPVGIGADVCHRQKMIESPQICKRL